MKLILELILALFLWCATCRAGELHYNCSGHKIKLSNQLRVLYDTNTRLQEVLLQRSLHGLRGSLGAGVSVSRLTQARHLPEETLGEERVGDRRIRNLGDNFDKYGWARIPKPKPKPTTSKPHHTSTPSGHSTTPKPPPPSNPATSSPPEPTTPRPVPVVPTTSEATEPATTPEPEPTNPEPEPTTPVPVPTTPAPVTTEPEPTTPEGRRTTGPVSTTREQRRTTSRTTPERRRTTPPPAAPVVLDLEVDTGVWLGEQLLIRITEGEQRGNWFRLNIERSDIRLTADSLVGVLRGMEVLGELMERDHKGGHSLPECEVY